MAFGLPQLIFRGEKRVEYQAGERVIYFKNKSGGGFLCQMIPAEFVAYCRSRVKIKIRTKDGEVVKSVGRDSIGRDGRNKQ